MAWNQSKPCLVTVEELVGVEVLGERLAAAQPEVDAVVVVADHVVRAGDDAVMYGLIRGVVANVHSLAGPAASVDATLAPFETTCQCSGAVTWKVKVALRSGWSKQA